MIANRRCNVGEESTTEEVGRGRKLRLCVSCWDGLTVRKKLQWAKFLSSPVPDWFGRHCVAKHN